ncbi:Scr1 family TA system antitoxin-like transcriptional regulator [Streptomyces sp. NPDC058665]|uniref:Scr1 family TA system antitoxin-like transcriptional regulator n=1 Tax=Streptomyces sp. NPDC058665 TaxID=3346586 RepID=UPI00365F0D27
MDGGPDARGPRGGGWLLARIEAEAISRMCYGPLLIPGSLQTEEYARALFSAHCLTVAGKQVLDPLHQAVSSSARTR